MFLAASIPFSIAAAHSSLAVLFLLAAYHFRTKKQPFIRTPFDYCIIIYLSVLLAAALVGVNPTRSLRNLAPLWHVALYVMVVNWVPDRRIAIRLLFILMIVTGLNGLYGIIQHLVGGLDLFPVGGHAKIMKVGDQVRATGNFSHYMTFAGQMLMVSLLATGLLIFWIRGKAILYMSGGIAVLFGGLLVSFTRSAWLGLIAGLLTIGWIKGRKAFAGLAIAMVVAFLVSFTIFPQVQARAISIVNIKTDESNLDRIRVWRATIDMIQDHILLGIGRGNYRTVLNEYRERYGGRSHAHAHNTLLQQTAENGIIGLSAYLFVWYVFFREGFRTLRHSSDPFIRGITAGALGALVGFHVAGLFEYNFGDSEVAMMMWFIVGMAMAARSGNFEAHA